MKKKTIALAVLLAAAAVLVGIHIFRTGDISSAQAYISGTFENISIMNPGIIKYSAAEGQFVNAGDPLVAMEDGELLKKAAELKNSLEQQLEGVPQHHLELFYAYYAIPEKTTELEQTIKEARTDEVYASQNVTLSSEDHAALLIRLRGLELKPGKLKEHLDNIKAMQVEEAILSTRLETAKKQHEKASLFRSGLERKYVQKRRLEAAFSGLPETLRVRLQNLEQQFKELQMAEENLAQSVIAAPAGGQVLCRNLDAGDTAASGQTALVFAAASNTERWITALFAPGKAVDSMIGKTCTVSIEGIAEPISGKIATKLPHVPSAAGKTEVAVRVEIDDYSAFKIRNICPQAAVEVKLAP